MSLLLTASLMASLAGGASCGLRCGGVEAMTLADDGTVFHVRREQQPGAPALVIDVAPPGGESWAMVVPASTGPDVEEAAGIVALPAGGGVVVVWEARTAVFSRLLMSSWDNVGWSAPIELPANVYAEKRGIQLVAQRDDLVTEDGAEARLIIHALWCEGDPGVGRCRYALVEQDRGAAPALTIARDLGSLFAEQDPWDVADAGWPLATLTAGVRGGELLAAFPVAERAGLGVLGLRLAPDALVGLADSLSGLLRAAIAAGQDRDALAADARAHMILHGSEHFRETLLDELASVALAALDAWSAAGSGDLDLLAAEARAHMILHGLESMGGPLVRGQGRLLGALEGEHEATGALVVVGLIEKSLRPLPPAGQDAIVYPSPSGRNQLVAWLEGQRVAYLESTPAGWSEPRFLVLTDTFDAALADRLLRQRATQLE